MEPKMHLWVCVRAVPVYVFSGPHCCLTVSSLEPARSCLHWGRGPGPWWGPLGHEQNWQKKNRHRLDAGQLTDRFHCGLASSTAGWCGCDQKPLLGPPQG
ncbi:unnamed protein product [Rangifer tarandus platyrhynchus]|uniref:Uncharacterized protein n=2 Tax=Rangifer tarandus platyrhynchus TaxID=3082113 RepID=A0AC59ZG89_RANTA|nr:unnamed protein product [Rangifer tarandus platyrhynchus]